MTPQSDRARSARQAPTGLARYRGAAVVATVCLVVFAGLVMFLRGLLDDPPRQVDQVVQIQVVRPPPPPPPPPPQETPPEVREEVEIPEPERLADLPDMPDAAPSNQLGLDADGVAGGDAFGLLANRGGMGLVGSEGRYRWYAQRVKDQINDALAREEAIRSRTYRVRVLVWLDDAGQVAQLRMAESTGDPALDAQLTETIRSMRHLGDAPPTGFPQPVSLRIEGRV